MSDVKVVRPVVEFDHHSSDMPDHNYEVYDKIRAVSPVTWTEAHGGYWFVTGYKEMSRVARDDATFCSDSNQGGVNIPKCPPNGMIETDPPRFRKIRSQFNPLFTQAAADALQSEILDYTTACIDEFIESGRADLLQDLTSPVPAILTVRMMGLPLEEWKKYADMLHRAVSSGFDPSGPDAVAVGELLQWFGEQAYKLAKERRQDPKDDLISFLAHMKVDGELLPIDEVAGNIFLLTSGGVDTTSALMAHTLVHLSRDHNARRWLTEDLSRLPTACEEYLRWVTPVQHLARTATTECTIGGQAVEPGERVLMSWAAANHDPTEFDDPNAVHLDRTPNRHAAFGLGIHRCLGSHVARLTWRMVIGEVLRRLPDFEVDESAVNPYPSIGNINGLLAVPATFTPGPRVGSTFTY